MEQHPLVKEACAMGFDMDHAAAALLSFADSKSGGSARQLTLQKHGDAFIAFLFEFDRPAQQQQVTQQQQQQATKQPTRQQQGKTQQHGRQQAWRDCKRNSPDTDSIESAEEDTSMGDSDFVMDEEAQLHDAGFVRTAARHRQPQQQQQQPRKRLHRSCEAAAGPPPAQAADSDSDPAVQTARHKRRVLADSSSEDAGDTAGADGAPFSAAAEAAAAGGGSGGAGTRGAAGVRKRYQHAAADLDFLTTHVTPAPATAAKGGSRGTPALQTQRQQTQQQHQVQQQTQKHQRSGVKQPLTQPKQKKAAAAAAGAGPNQPRLERFFSTPAQQAAAAGGPAAATGRSGPSPLNLSRISSSAGPSSNSFASRMAAGEGCAAASRVSPGSFKTPAHALRGPASHTTPAAGAAGFGSAGGLGGQHQQGFGPAAVAAAAGPMPAWNQPLAADEAELDHYDLVNLKVFGHSSFRPSQKEIVQQAVQGRDLFVLMPTGGGKSLCYQLPAVMRPGVTVVVCPLLSLMQDQVRALCQNPNGGIPASFLSSQQSEGEAVAVKKELSKPTPTVKLLYVTPEQLVKSNALRNILRRLEQNGKLARFVIDEAHCVSTWGHDFRPDYKGLRVLRSEFKLTPITAVTATATREVQADILSTLGITRTVTVHQTSFLRPNLLLRVVPKVRELDDEGQHIYIAKLIEYIKKQTAHAAAQQQQQQQQQQQEPLGQVACSGIVYCLSRKEAESLAQVLREQGRISASHYHAGMTPRQRTEVQNAFFSGAVQVIVATIAFGMGIDKPDVRFVVHFCLSKSLEGYYQEAGRAGRDGQPAECVLMYNNFDVNRQRFVLGKSMGGNKSTDRFAKAVNQLETMKEYALAGKTCRHAQLLEYFGVLQTDLPDRQCIHSCDVCRGEVVPLDPKDWEAAPDKADGLIEEEVEVDEEDSEEQQQEQEQQQRSGGRRRPSIYDAAAAAGDGEGQDGVAGGRDSGIEILDSSSEVSSEDEGDSGSSGSESWDDGYDESGDEGCDGPPAAAAAGSGAPGRHSGGGSRPGPDQQQQQEQQQPGMRIQQQPNKRKQQQGRLMRLEPATPVFEGFQMASQLQQQFGPDNMQQQQQHDPIGWAGADIGFQRASALPQQGQQQRRQPKQPVPPQQQQQQQQQQHVPQQQHERLQPQAQPSQQHVANCGGFQRASELQQPQQVQRKQQQANLQQKRQPDSGQAGLGLGSSRFNRVAGRGLSRLTDSQQQQQLGNLGRPTTGSGSAAGLQQQPGLAGGTGGVAAAVGSAGVAVATAATHADVPWIQKKANPIAKRLGMCGMTLGGAGCGSSSGGSSRVSPADALAAELRAADNDDMFQTVP